jgi:dimethylargininase
VSPTFANALCATPPDPPIDLALARDQHREYQLALLACGLELRMLGASEDPDGCFVEDTAVVAGHIALITRPGAPSRRAETARVAESFAQDLELVRMEAPATLDGGDVMRVGKTIFVGRSARTNEQGIARLAEVFEPRGYRVVPVAMPAGVLHLKSCCAPLADDRITLADGSIPSEAFGDLHIVRVPEEETYAANCLAIGNRVLAAKGYPRTCNSLASAGFDVTELDTSEFRKADGALTCLSILF